MQDAERTFSDDRGKERVSLGTGHSRRPVYPGLAAMLLTCASVAGATSTAGEAEHQAHTDAETIVRMYATAVVTADQVTLADVAEIEGETARLSAHWPIAQAPKAGAWRCVDLSLIQKVLARRGANLGHWVFRGHTQCRVTRPARSNTKQSATPEGSQRHEPNTQTDQVQNANSADADSSAKAGSTSIGDAEADRARFNPDTLGGALHQYIAKRLENVGGSPLIELPPTVTRLLGLTGPVYHFRVEDRSDRLLGLVPLSVTIYEKDQVKQVLQVVVKVSLRKPVVVAARQINRGQTIGAAELAIEDRVFDRVQEIGLTETGSLIGQRAKNFITKGEQIRSRDIESVPLVRRNDLVTVIVRRGNLMIKGSARALGSGGYGDVVELKNEMARRSAESFTAVVTGYRTAEVPARGRDPVKVAAFQRKGL